VNGQPKDQRRRLDNFMAFSDEGRQEEVLEDSEALPVRRIPCMKECYGWLKISGQGLVNLNDLRPPVLTKLD
ncbi:hypothetical protein QBC46DRAFT_265182, partial [Diplogelasinospora grovesii]